jgi:hypothetical protein
MSHAEQHKIFAEMLMKCFAIDARRRTVPSEEVRLFVRQAVKDSEGLFQGKVPDDITRAKK